MKLEYWKSLSNLQEIKSNEYENERKQAGNE